VNARVETWLVRILRPLAYFVLGALGLLVPVCAALFAAQAFGQNAIGLAVAIVLAVAASFWWCRVILTATWWLKTGAWDWRRTGFLYSTRTGWRR
jgi:hypothetical protein